VRAANTHWKTLYSDTAFCITTTIWHHWTWRGQWTRGW